MRQLLTVAGAVAVFFLMQSLRNEKQIEPIQPPRASQIQVQSTAVQSLMPKADNRSQRSYNPDCNRALNEVLLQTSVSGMQVVTIEETEDRQTLNVNAEIEFLPDRVQEVTAKTAMTVTRLWVSEGMKVQKGDVLFEAQSRELADARSSWLMARSRLKVWKESLKRETELLKASVGNQRDLANTRQQKIEAELALSRAEQKLAWFGYTQTDYEKLQALGKARAHLKVRSEVDGVVQRLDAVTGTHVEEGKSLLQIADSSRLRARLWVPPSRIHGLSLEQPFTLRSGSRQAVGSLKALPSFVDPHTRLAAVFGEFENTEFMAGEYVGARLEFAFESGLRVPLDAIQWDGCCNMVFEQLSDQRFQPHKVDLGTRTSSWQEVRDGLSPGMRIVTEGSFLLKSVLLESQMGDACCG